MSLSSVLRLRAPEPPAPASCGSELPPAGSLPASASPPTLYAKLTASSRRLEVCTSWSLCSAWKPSPGSRRNRCKVVSLGGLVSVGRLAPEGRRGCALAGAGEGRSKRSGEREPDASGCGACCGSWCGWRCGRAEHAWLPRPPCSGACCPNCCACWPCACGSAFLGAGLAAAAATAVAPPLHSTLFFLLLLPPPLPFPPALLLPLLLLLLLLPRLSRCLLNAADRQAMTELSSGVPVACTAMLRVAAVLRVASTCTAIHAHTHTHGHTRARDLKITVCLVPPVPRLPPTMTARAESCSRAGSCSECSPCSSISSMRRSSHSSGESVAHVYTTNRCKHNHHLPFTTPNRTQAAWLCVCVCVCVCARARAHFVLPVFRYMSARLPTRREATCASGQATRRRCCRSV